MENQVYTLRNLNADDVFHILRIINKVGVKEVKGCFDSLEVKQLLSNTEDGAEVDVSAVGMSIMMDIVSLVVSRLPECQRDLYAFLASLSDMKVEEIAALPMGTFVKMIIDVLKKQEFKDFFTDVIGYLK